MSGFRQSPRSLLIAGACCLWPVVAISAETSESTPAGHGDPFSMVFAVFTVLLLCAVVGRYAAVQLKQSPVLGELVIGIIVGALVYQFAGPTVTIIRHSELVGQATTKALYENQGLPEALKAILAETKTPEHQARKIEQVLARPDFPAFLLLARAIELFASLGVILLLFMVGLECSLEEMTAVGGRATGVAIIGMVAPFVLGFGATKLLCPGTGVSVPVFVGATLSATSIGITSRVFKDLNVLHLKEAQVVLGAAVIDDVLGLVALAVVTGVATSGQVSLAAVGLILLKATLFLGGVIFFGLFFLKRQIAFFSRLDAANLRLLYPFALLLLFSWLADALGLATIVGAFAAGLIIKEEYFPTTPECHFGGQGVRSVIAPLEGVFAPVFFVLMGSQVDVTTFLEPSVLVTGLVLTLVAMLGKLAAGLGVAPTQDRWVVGLGLAPRGEVGLIFASIGRAIGVLDSQLFSSVIVVVLLTTLLTPPLLTWALRGRGK
jgi:Kef-type K+ transport system membrane component KefB